MAKPFDTVAAKRIIKEHRTTIEKLNNIQADVLVSKEAIKTASEELVAQEVIKILREIPIEEINRDKRGFRVKALRDHGYETIADVATASVYSIASVHGISSDSAYSIKHIADDIVSKARQGAKIKLSTDNKTKEAAKLISSISKYKQKQPIVKECRKLLDEYEKKIEYATEDLQAAIGGIRWIFASKAKKQRAIDAYNTLKMLSDNDFGTEAKECFDRLYEVENSDINTAWDDFTNNSVQFINILEDINPGLLGNDDLLYGLPDELAREIQEESFFPEGLRCELRRYQEWGVKYALHQERVLLGDEMGLGKTVQAIATMVSLRNTGATHFIVICPASVIANWCREIRKMSLLSVTKIHGSNRLVAMESWKRTGGVAVTTFETTAYFSFDNEFKFSLLVVDEAHYIKNPEANRTKNVKKIIEHTDRLLFMTGTALENRVDEMVSLIDILQPKIARKVHGVEALSAAPQFRQAVSPVYYRRKREDVLTELPELIISKEWCTLNHEEEAIYEESVLMKKYHEARRVSWNVDNVKYSSKGTRLLELVAEAESDGRKVIVFSFFLDTIQKVIELLGSRCTNPINGSVSPQRRQEIIDDFDNAPAGTVLVAQIQSGGTGLNIQSASVVILCEPQFKPSIENQAISRAYRMGQTRNVLVYRLLCENTVEEKIMETLESKQAIFDAFADKSEAAQDSLELDERTFGNIIKEEIDRINEKNGNKNREEEKTV
ncbi:DEAD/DEAH box helicase [Eubacterium xylanophilum]|uniref:DEAD/DEAH box helicase n=1 Tax=Eubacterium xylanophilum TaxID=39497 RepID=UPI0004BAE196|nr:DEAD/DEAH box helicase [Eubacterium xylanophilum]